NILNMVAGNVGQTVHFAGASPWEQVARYGDVKALLAAMNAGAVDVALVHGSNPAFTLPAGAHFGAAFQKVKLKVALASSLDETTALCDLVLPAFTPLESWGALQPVAGALSMVQPAVRPVVRGAMQAADVLLAVAQKAGKRVGTAASARDLATAGVANLEAVLQHGGAFETAAPRSVRMTRDFARLDFRPATFDGTADGLVLLPVPSATLYDGRGANKAVLQEIPDPTTKITWQTWVEVHPDTSWRFGIFDGDEVEVAAGDRKVRALVYVYPGVRPDVVAMPIGRGHTAYGRYADNGANPLALLGDVSDPSGALAFCQTRVTLTKTGTQRPLATTEGSARQMGRGIARQVALSEVGHPPERHEELTEAERTAIGAAAASQGQRRDVGVYAKPHPKWEMVIDLSRCTGCAACVAACYQENNIATVGESQVVRSREMAWIRLERYFEGDTAGTDWSVAMLPMLCQQCANAPCEPVCPVYAAYHTPDGLNGQIYNRCVGTRYCANNCPYKVRYFNFWDYGAPDAPKYAWPGTLELGLNPDVTVRTKGVMEKCTFCVQRIRFAQNDARVRGLEGVGDGAFTTACAQTCPASAITFGDAHDPESRVSAAKQDQRGYRVFEQLNTQPGVTYLSRVIAGAAPGGEGR
ncbi:MAG TPA: molybdopterin dinucleotide binding domain-containing protein, partial [Candidatus Binatia bacterium]|nr:molybdopterin dinucleotide binding domain-containing protein [Candidatus Binatia bacterium]